MITDVTKVGIIPIGLFCSVFLYVDTSFLIESFKLSWCRQLKMQTKTKLIKALIYLPMVSNFAAVLSSFYNVYSLITFLGIGGLIYIPVYGVFAMLLFLGLLRNKLCLIVRYTGIEV